MGRNGRERSLGQLAGELHSLAYLPDTSGPDKAVRTMSHYAAYDRVKFWSQICSGGEVGKTSCCVPNLDMQGTTKSLQRGRIGWLDGTSSHMEHQVMCGFMHGYMFAAINFWKVGLGG